MKFLLQIVLLLYLFHLNAQEGTTIKLVIEGGILPLSETENLGLFLNAEPKLKISDNIFLGLRVGVILNAQSIENNDEFQYEIDERSDNGGISLVPTIDYYLNENYFRPYLGLGIGPYLLTKYIDVFDYSSQSRFEVNVKNQAGFLVRGGLESDKIRFGLEYNYILKADVEVPNGQIIGTINNSYFGLAIGFIIGHKKKSE